MERTRRAILASTAAFLGVGCLGRDAGGGTPDPGTSTDTTTTPPTGTTTAPPTTEPPDPPALETLAVHRSVRRQGTVHTDVEGGVFVVATFVDDGTAVRSDATLVLDGEDHDPVEWMVPAPSGEVAVAFEFPAAGVDAGEGRLEWGTESRALSGEALERLAAPPRFAVREFSVPGEAAPESEVTVTITVENVGGSDGRFLAEFGTLGLSDQGEITIDVPAGERVTETRSTRLVRREEDEETVVLGPAGDRIERTVSLPQS